MDCRFLSDLGVKDLESFDAGFGLLGLIGFMRSQRLSIMDRWLLCFCGPMFLSKARIVAIQTFILLWTDASCFEKNNEFGK